MALVKLTIITTFYAIIHANKQGEMDFMLEVFSRDRNTDFEFFEFTKKGVKSIKVLNTADTFFLKFIK